MTVSFGLSFYEHIYSNITQRDQQTYSMNVKETALYDQIQVITVMKKLIQNNVNIVNGVQVYLLVNYVFYSKNNINLITAQKTLKQH